MKYSNYIGVLVALALIASCYVPWVYIESINTTVTGLKAEHTNFGRPGLIHVFMSAIAILLFIIHKIWAKRLNVFIGALNFAWAIRNFLVVTRCELGECPVKKMGIYAVLVLSFFMLLMSMLPKMKVINKED